MRNLKSLRGAKELSKSAQQSVKGGKRFCAEYDPCPPGWMCVGSTCVRSWE